MFKEMAIRIVKLLYVLSIQFSEFIKMPISCDNYQEVKNAES